MFPPSVTWVPYNGGFTEKIRAQHICKCEASFFDELDLGILFVVGIIKG